MDTCRFPENLHRLYISQLGLPPLIHSVTERAHLKVLASNVRV